MMEHFRTMAALVFLGWALGPMQGIAAERQGSIGYPSIEAALADLEKKPSISQRIRRHWIIIEDFAAKTIWSFTRPSNPAHPAVFRRVLTLQPKNVSIKLHSLCRGEKSACDILTTQFRKKDQKNVSDFTNMLRAKRQPWRPSRDYLVRVVALTQNFLAALEAQDWRQAYNLFGPGLKAKLTYEFFVKHRQTLEKIAGGKLDRTNKNITWYKDPVRQAPGVYAAINIACDAPKRNYCKELIILHERPGGEFKIIRQETNLVDPERLKYLLERQRQLKKRKP